MMNVYFLVPLDPPPDELPDDDELLLDELRTDDPLLDPEDTLLLPDPVGAE
jgi:hypothetical protein